MAESSLANMILKSAGIYSDDQLERIAAGRASNPGMGLAEAAVKFGGSREADFLKAVGASLGLEVVDLDHRQPNPDVLTKLPASPRRTSASSAMRSGARSAGSRFR